MQQTFELSAAEWWAEYDAFANRFKVAQKHAAWLNDNANEEWRALVARRPQAVLDGKERV